MKLLHNFVPPNPSIFFFMHKSQFQINFEHYINIAHLLLFFSPTTFSLCAMFLSFLITNGLTFCSCTNVLKYVIVFSTCLNANCAQSLKVQTLAAFLYFYCENCGLFRCLFCHLEQRRNISISFAVMAYFFFSFCCFAVSSVDRGCDVDISADTTSHSYCTYVNLLVLRPT